jgi:hypothetical protein
MTATKVTSHGPSGPSSDRSSALGNGRYQDVAGCDETTRLLIQALIDGA